ncbi:MAG: hypothetical protein DKINENOH_05623 [bacterium]|nr:hypothetical protein [bacterium]
MKRLLLFAPLVLMGCEIFGADIGCQDPVSPHPPIPTPTLQFLAPEKGQKVKSGDFTFVALVQGAEVTGAELRVENLHAKVTARLVGEKELVAEVTFQVTPAITNSPRTKRKT